MNERHPMPSCAKVVVPVRSDRRASATLAVASIVAILAAYHQTVQSMITTWERSDTFAHGFLIFPISAWLVWNQRKQLAALQFQPEPYAQLSLAILGFGWLMAYLADVKVAQQYFLVGMIPLTVLSVLGKQVVLALAFPLAYLLLAVPFGHAFIPTLIDLTASFTVLALQLTGVPVYREGNFFTVPSGSWSVIEACSGLRYLIASFTLGTLYAYLSYRSLKRRLIFIGLSIVVPIVANCIRAYMIVMIGHLSGMRYAVGVDHLIYGWFFFGFVMLLLFWTGSRWREDNNDKSSTPPANFAASKDQRSFVRATRVACGSLAIAFFWPACAAYVEPKISDTAIKIDIAPVPGKWEPSTRVVSDWKPSYVGPSVQFMQTYQHADRTVSLHIAYYRNGRQGPDLVHYENVLVSEGSERWRNINKEEARRLSVSSRAFEIRQNLLYSSTVKLITWRWYRVAGENTTSPYAAKLMLAKSRLLGHEADGAEIIIATPYEDGTEEAASALQDFLDEMLPAVTKGIDHAAAR